MIFYLDKMQPKGTIVLECGQAMLKNGYKVKILNTINFKKSIEILERRIQEEDSAEVNEMVRTAKVTPEQLAALLRQSATATPNPAALSAVGATFEKEDADDD